ncbi:uncharacterized protein [Drosophila takahashii]|uniref:uncharacterized protein n=1 Tax=Drosophila takahashii TaxID=29030 RepID=UPI0007E71294|nr:uncharacterized protein LOC108067440 [Drosophila takahashii]
MKGLNFFVVLALYYPPFGAAIIQSPVYTTICKRTGGSITCYQDNTWGFDERTRKCFRVRKGYGPCGFFDGKKGCVDFCLKTSG